MSDEATQAAELDACFQSVERVCAERGLSVLRDIPAPPQCLRFGLAFSGSMWTLEVDCTWPRYSALPSVRLLAPLPMLAHVSYDGAVCINDSQGLSVDLDRQADVVGYSAGLAIDLLAKSVADAAVDRVEFYNEFEGYWHGLPSAFMARAAFEVNETSRQVSCLIETRGKRHDWYFTEKDVAPPDEFYIKTATKVRALYIVMSEPVAPPAPGEALDASYLERLVAKFSPEQVELWDAMLGPTMNNRKRISLLVSVPRQAGGRSVIGITFFAYKRKLDAAQKLVPFNIRRHTVSHMRARGGATADLATKHIVVFGCGSVGSEVADALASSGVGKLTLVDHDTFTEDNVFRHVLGPTWVGVPKASALKYVLEPRYPGLVVESAEEYAQAWIRKANLDAVDGFALALGAPTAERLIMRRLRRSGREVPAVVTWLEPLDLGSHAVGVSLVGKGCLDCLYRDEEGQPDLAPRTSFMVPGQHVSRNLTGCAGAFVPYGALQSRKAAHLASELLLDALAGQEMPSYRFLPGAGTAAEREGLQTTPWWQLAKSNWSEKGTEMAFGRPCAHCRSKA